MCQRIVLSAIAAAVLTAPAGAAPAVRVKVDEKGVLRIPAATLKKLGVKPDRDQSVMVEFPRPPQPTPRVPVPLAPKQPEIRQPLRILVPVDRGMVRVPRTRVDAQIYVPGPPGQEYRATGSGNVVILKKL